MTNDITKTMTVRFYSANDSDLIDMAVSQSGAVQSEWARQALIFQAEFQVLKGGLAGLTLKNLFLVRKLVQSSDRFSESQITDAMKWATKETEKYALQVNKREGQS